MFRRNGFGPLLFAQALGAFNDNAFRALVSLAALAAPSSSRSLLVALAGAVFVLPYLLFSTYAGWLADRFSKRNVIVAAKSAEVGVMALGGLAMMSGQVPVMMAVLFLLGSRAAFFSPARLGIIPELVPEKELSPANGLMELATFLSIIGGLLGGGLMFATFGVGSPVPPLILTGVAVGGTLLALGVLRVPASGGHRPFRVNFIAEVIGDFRSIALSRPLLLTVLGVAWFWFLGMIFQLNVMVYARELMGLDEGGVTLLNACVSIGIGVGAVIAGKLSGETVEMGLVPLGSLGLGFFALVLYFAHVSLPLAAAAHALLGVSAGFFILPLDAYLQKRAPRTERGRIIAASNFLAFSAVMMGSGWVALCGLLGWSPATVMLATGLISIAVTAYILRLLPDFLVRLLLWLLAHTVYRITVRGEENLPRKGGALLVCNHISFVDAFLVGASTQRFVRFLMYRPIYEARAIHWFAKLMGCIPVSEKDGREGVSRSLSAARDRLLAGDLVCIFAEGSISRTGNLLRFRKGFESIVAGTDAPVIPMHLDGVWGSIFSYQGGRFLWKWPRRIPYPATISIGRPLPSRTEAWQVRQTVMELSADAFAQRKTRQHPLHITFIQTAKRYPRRACVADSSGIELSFRRALAGSLALSGLVRKIAARDGGAADGGMIGILLPPSVAGALLNVAVLLAGRTPVNLNYTASAEALESAIARCRIRTVFTSEKLLEALEMPGRAGMVMVEDVYAGIGPVARALALSTTYLPARAIAALLPGPRASMDDLATIIFTSGSTSTPKGVMLTHHNIISNVEAMQQIFDIASDDRMIGVLPLFHSFGFTATLWLPLTNGFGVVYHSNPLAARVVGGLCQRHRVTFLLATPTFLSAYLKACTKEQFASLRYVVVGAEKLTTALADSFKEKFGVEPLEGYGATELSPAATMSMPDVEQPGAEQIGHKPGSIGQPIPGVAARIVDPETFKERAVGEEGLLLIRGANVMKGYLGEPGLTAEVMRDGWYITGDIAKYDADGFITLTDRLSQFARIAGEMVPLGGVEEAIQSELGPTGPLCVVTSVPDASRGERLVVLYAGADLDPGLVISRLAQRGLPSLWIPRRESFHRIEAIPILGTGKLDLGRVKKLAAQLEQRRPPRV